MDQLNGKDSMFACSDTFLRLQYEVWGGFHQRDVSPCVYICTQYTAFKSYDLLVLLSIVRHLGSECQC